MKRKDPTSGGVRHAAPGDRDRRRVEPGRRAASGRDRFPRPAPDGRWRLFPALPRAFEWSVVPGPEELQ